MMKKLFTLLLAAAGFAASAQGDIDYPYNPDFENDGFVGIEDVLELLSVYGTPFTPEQLLLDGASLTEIIESLQSQIDSLASYTNEAFGAIALNDSLLTEYLVGVAAASEEGDSTLGAWVMQLSEMVELQQVQIDSLQYLQEEATPFDSIAMVLSSGELVQGDMLVRYNSNWTPLVAGSEGSILTIRNGLPVWENQSLVGTNFEGGQIGLFFQPGDPGFIYGEQHGIIINLNSGLCGTWGCMDEEVGLTASEFGSGQNNTNILAGLDCTTSSSAANICQDLSWEGYDDWYLPSADEITRIVSGLPSVLDVIETGFGPGCQGAAWLSTEHSASQAKIQSTFSLVGEGKTSTRMILPCRNF